MYPIPTQVLSQHKNTRMLTVILFFSLLAFSIILYQRSFMKLRQHGYELYVKDSDITILVNQNRRNNVPLKIDEDKQNAPIKSVDDKKRSSHLLNSTSFIKKSIATQKINSSTMKSP